MTTDLTPSPVRLHAVAGKGQPDPTPELEQLYRGFEQELLVPLWTQIGDLMPRQPQSKAVPHLWRWDRLKALAAQAGAIVPVGRGGGRRAIALGNPALGGRPFATPTLWAAIQYLMPGEDAPEHRHTQHAFRFVVEGEGVWTVVNGDAVRMSRGDFLPQAGWNWHAHHTAATEPMAWIDGLDIPFSYYTESQFFEVGREKLPPAERTTAERSYSERLWGHPGLRPAPMCCPRCGPKCTACVRAVQRGCTARWVRPCSRCLTAAAPSRWVNAPGRWRGAPCLWCRRGSRSRPRHRPLARLACSASATRRFLRRCTATVCKSLFDPSLPKPNSAFIKPRRHPPC